MDPKNISIADFTYDLPDSAIAFYPLPERDASRLLVYRSGAITETTYRNIAAQLPAASVLVFNNTRVVEARLVFQKPSGGRVEIFCLEPPPDYGGIAAAMAKTGQVRWKCLIGGASKWKAGQVLVMTIGEVVIEARYLEKGEDSFLIELTWRPPGLSFAAMLHLAGLIPLPPYIHRTPETADSERYQTIYADRQGSVAAPTAGLHFTERVLSSLKEKGMGELFVTLHVGAGTFLPVKSPTLREHPMHTEYISVTRQAIEGLLSAKTGRSVHSVTSTPLTQSAKSTPSTPPTPSAGRPVIAVGTTSARTIESLYWLGVKVLATPNISLADLTIRQWDAYEMAGMAGMARPGPEYGIQATAGSALTALLEWMKEHDLSELVTATQLLITPGYIWRVADGLITNFHQPESTLLLLVASLIGEDWRKVYDYALTNGFRFLSYGDGCLFIP